MRPANAPFAAPVNVRVAQQAVAILQRYGQVVGRLPITQGAAGYATADPASPWPANRQLSAFTQITRANQVWQQGCSGRGVTIAVLDSGVANDADLVGRCQSRRTPHRSPGTGGPPPAGSADGDLAEIVQNALWHVAVRAIARNIACAVS